MRPSDPRSLVPALNRRAWIVLAADAVSALGNGLIIPFLVVYLRDVRGFPIEHVGLVLSTVAAAGFVSAPAAGWLIDRRGPRLALAVALLGGATAALGAIAVDELWEAFLWAIVFGGSISAMWPGAHSLLASIVPPQQRAAIYSMHFALLNAGIGVGAVVAGLIADVDRPITFAAIFLLDAATFLVYVAVLWLAVPRDLPVEAAGGDAPTAGKWRRVWADRAFRRVCVLSVGLVTVGYAQLQSSFPAYATRQGGLGTSALGAVFAVNTAVIALLQLVVLRRLAGTRRVAALATVGWLWAATWLVTIGGGVAPHGVAAFGLLAAASGLFALGETFLQAALPALVNDLAPDDLRGRYNAVNSLTWSSGNVLGPLLAGFLLGAGRGTELFLLLALGCVVATFYAWRLERHLPEPARSFAAREPRYDDAEAVEPR